MSKRVQRVWLTIERGTDNMPLASYTRHDARKDREFFDGPCDVVSFVRAPTSRKVPRGTNR